MSPESPEEWCSPCRFSAFASVRGIKHRLAKHATVDVCLVLKEPTLAIDFTAAVKGGNDEERLHAIAKSMAVNASLVGEKVFADVAQNQETGELELYVTKPYLENGMATVHFG